MHIIKTKEKLSFYFKIPWLEKKGKYFCIINFSLQSKYHPLIAVFLRLHIEPPHDKTNKMTVRPAKIQISLGNRPVWSESSLCAQWVAKGLSFLHADSEDSDQTGRMLRLIWVFTGRTCHFVGFVMRRLFLCILSATSFRSTAAGVSMFTFTIVLNDCCTHHQLYDTMKTFLTNF